MEAKSGRKREEKEQRREKEGEGGSNEGRESYS
jgi:hypothetical protein